MCKHKLPEFILGNGIAASQFSSLGMQLQTITCPFQQMLFSRSLTFRSPWLEGRGWHRLCFSRGCQKTGPRWKEGTRFYDEREFSVFLSFFPGKSSILLRMDLKKMTQTQFFIEFQFKWNTQNWGKSNVLHSLFIFKISA